MIAAGTALITGVAGQDGVLLARMLRARGYHVIGTVPPGNAALAAMQVYLDGIVVVEHDLRDRPGFARLLDEHAPDEIYNLAAFSSVARSWGQAEVVAQINGMAVLGILEELVARRDSGYAPRFYHASTSEIFGLATEQPQTETTPHHPRSPYAVAKSFAHHLTVNYRESYDLFACCGILYNHESVLRPRHFVTRKITRAAAEISLGLREHIDLGNLGVCRDWGAAEDYVEAMASMLQRDEPRDYVIATGVSHTLEDLLVRAFSTVGIDDPWPYVRQDPALERPAEVARLQGDPSRAAEELGWSPRHTFDDVIERMVAIDVERLTTGVEEDPAYLLAGA